MDKINIFEINLFVMEQQPYEPGEAVRGDLILDLKAPLKMRGK